MEQTTLKEHRPHTHVVLAILVAVTVTIVITSVLSGTMTVQRAAMVENIPAVSFADTMQTTSISGAVPFGQNADEVRALLEQFHSSYRSQVEMVEQLSAQNSSMLSLYQQTVSPYSQDSSISITHSLASLPSASSRAQSSVMTLSSSLSAFSVSSSASSVVTSETSVSSSESSKQVSQPSEASSSSQVSQVTSSSQVSQTSSLSVSPRVLALRETFGKTINRLSTSQSTIALKLMKDLTLTPLGEEYVLTFVTADLPAIQMTPQYADVVFMHFKLLNGNELKQLGVVPNADVDPKDWYAESVATVHELNIMKGSGRTGLFEGERPMNQAELATTLANAMNLAGGTLAHPAAQQADVFQAWPAWGKNSISELRARGIDTSFFRANPEEPVNRLQLARAISDSIFRGDSVDISKARYFYDTVNLPPSVQQYVSKMSSLGVMTGNPQTLTFDPYAQTNRAQVAKTIAYAISVKVGAKTLSSSAR